MTGWVQTLEGSDVYEQDGWIWFPRQQEWRWEPALLTMPKAPVSERVHAEVERLSTDWPTLKEAWRWQGPYAGGWLTKAARVWVLFAGLYNLCMVPLWVTGLSGMHDWGETANHAAIRGIFFGVAALFCLFGIWHSHVWRRDSHKGLLVAGVVGTWAAWREHERREHRRFGGH